MPTSGPPRGVGGPRGRWWPRGFAGDVALAAAAAVITLVMSWAAARPGDAPIWPGGVLLILVGTVPLVFRRRRPILVLVVSGLVAPLYYPMGYPDGPLAFVFLVALFNAALECRLVVALGAIVAIDVAFVVAGLLRDADPGRRSPVVDSGAVASLSAFLVGTVALGQYVRDRRARILAAELRAAEAERGREEEARRRATEERLRIARELHDVLAHQISLINVQAGAALFRRDDPAQAYASLEAIKVASKVTLRELRGVLGVLRQVDQDGAGGGPPVAPAPSLVRLGELLERASAAGLRVRLAGDLAPPARPAPGEPGPEPEPEVGAGAGAGAGAGVEGVAGGGALAAFEVLAGLPAPVDLAGYRIVQEALTNALRHAGAAAVTVGVRRTAEAVVVQVDDDGTGPSDPDAVVHGNGLRGMRERAAAAGGELTAGPGPAGGFRVWARLPLGGPAGQTREIM
nr:histidine kinase [Spirillospora sp. NBC_01491]